MNAFVMLERVCHGETHKTEVDAEINPIVEERYSTFSRHGTPVADTAQPSKLVLRLIVILNI